MAAPLRMQGLDLSAEPGSLTALMGGELRAARVLHVCWSRAACTACFNASCCQCKQSKASCPGGTAACHQCLDNLDALLSGQALADGCHGICVVAGSGAGKTTLMDCILGRKTTGLIRGEILVNGHPKEQATWSRVCG